MNINEVYTSKGDLCRPVKNQRGKVAMLQVLNSDIFIIAELEKPKNKWDSQAILKGGKNWESQAKFVEGKEAAEKVFNNSIGGVNKEKINEKYR